MGASAFPLFVRVWELYPNRWVALYTANPDNVDDGTTCSAPTLEDLVAHLHGGSEISRVVMIVAPAQEHWGRNWMPKGPGERAPGAAQGHHSKDS